MFPGSCLLGARGLLAGGKDLVGEGGNLAAPLLARSLGGGASSAGGKVFFAVISGVAFATILAVVAGLVISASGAIAHDLYTSVLHPEGGDEQQEVRVGRIAAVVIGAIAIVLALLAGKKVNIQFLVGLAFSVAASANFPALLLAVTWRRFTTAGAVCGVAFGLISSIVLIILSPSVWPGPASHAPFALTNPAIISVPLGFLGCVLGTLLSREPASEEAYTELRVRAETGLGAEAGGGGGALA